MNTAQRLRSLISQDDGGGSVLGLYRGEPEVDGGLTDFESSLAAWGYVYGMAYALTRLEDPFESPSAVADRAYEVAWSEFVRYSGHYEIPDRDELVKELDQAWEVAHSVSSHRQDVIVTPALSKAINRVIGAGGRIREEVAG